MGIGIQRLGCGLMSQPRLDGLHGLTMPNQKRSVVVAKIVERCLNLRLLREFLEVLIEGRSPLQQSSSRVENRVLRAGAEQSLSAARTHLNHRQQGTPIRRRPWRITNRVQKPKSSRML